MSEVIEQPSGDPVTEDDLRRMLAEARTQTATLEKERDTERNNRFRTQQELDTERAGRVTAEAERDTNATRAMSEAEQRYNAQKDSVLSGIAAQKTVAETAEEAYARHAEAGDWKEAAKAQRQMSEAAAKLDRLEAQRDFLETNKDKFTAQPVVQRAETRPQPSGDPITQLVKDVLPAERQWLEKRPNFVHDAQYRGRVFTASNFAVNSGFARGSEAYFKEVERVLGETPEVRAETRQETRQEPQQDRAPSSDLAPQRRPAPGQNASGGREIRLTADQAEVADGLYGQPNSPDYIADQGERYRHYHANLEKRRAAGRM